MPDWYSFERLGVSRSAVNSVFKQNIKNIVRGILRYQKRYPCVLSIQCILFVNGMEVY